MDTVTFASYRIMAVQILVCRAAARVAFWLYTKVSEEHTASIFGAEVKRVRKVMGYYSVNSKVRPGRWAKGGQTVYIIESN
jgi:hypothetical protein